MNVEMTVNGKKVKADTSPSLLLSDFLRENLNLDGHACRLRYLAMRRLRGPYRWCLDEELHAAGGQC